MKKENLDLQVGDKVTYKLINVKEHNIRIKSINNNVELDDFLLAIRNQNTITSIEILKIERPKYEVVEEKKELLTEEEKEFLKDMCKYYDVAYIQFHATYLTLSNDIDFVLLSPNYPKNLKFENVDYNATYTLKELGLEVNKNGIRKSKTNL